MPSLTRVHHRPRMLAPILLGGGVSVVLGCAGLAAGFAGERTADQCNVPGGLDLSQLAPRDRGFATRRLLACSDYAHGRIGAEDYRNRIALIDAAWIVPNQALPEGPFAVEPIVWADSVRAASTEYSKERWSAQEVVGAPDVYPQHGDIAQAWASRGPDDRAEWIEVGYATPTPIAGLEIYETYNPGAIDRIELVTVSGNVIEAYAAPAAPRGSHARVHQVDVACTDEPVVAVRVHLDSPAVPGWNELDAIGVVPCQP